MEHKEFLSESVKLAWNVKQFEENKDDPFFSLHIGEGAVVTFESSTVDCYQGTLLKIKPVKDGNWKVLETEAAKGGFNDRHSQFDDGYVCTGEFLLEQVQYWHDCWVGQDQAGYTISRDLLGVEDTYTPVKYDEE